MSAITPDFYDIVEVVLSIRWLEQGESFNRYFISFLENLVSANPYFTGSCLRMLVRALYGTFSLSRERLGSLIVLDECGRNSAKADNLHVVLDALSSLLRVVPTGPAALLSMLVDHFPHRAESVSRHENYMKALFLITESVPVLKEKILALCFDRMIRIDVCLLVLLWERLAV